MYECKILKDSISDQGYRLTTFSVTFPRFILAEVNTHRMLSRNSASSRAIPSEKVVRRIQENPFVPDFHYRVKGMGVGEPLSTHEQEIAKGLWQDICDHAIEVVEALDHVDKSRVNRLLEPFAWHTAIISGTDWGNFFTLRCSPDAQPEFRKIATMMREAIVKSEPRELTGGQWHLPLVDDQEIEDEALQWPEPYVDWEMWTKVSIGRCARVSYLTHEGKRDIYEDITLYDRLRDSSHLSPFEHVAHPFTEMEWEMVDTAQSALRMIYTDRHPVFVERICRQLEYCGNFQGWIQSRAIIPNEHDASLI